MKILFIGDIFGKMGRKAIEDYLPEIRKEHGINLVIANGENVAHGKGITKKTYKWLLEQGISVITMGNHTWDNKDIFTFIDDADKLLVPTNYQNTPGRGYVTFKYNDKTVTVISLIGRIFMQDANCPFITADKILSEIDSDVIIVDFHAEATSEKMALAHYLDGRVTAVLGTHTHVPTADARILEKGTLFQSDVGMTGPLDGIIGVEREGIINKFISGIPVRFNPMETGKTQFNGIIFEIRQNSTKFDTINIVK